MSKPKRNLENISTVWIPKPVHAEIKAHFMARGIKMSFGITELLKEFLKKQTRVGGVNE